MYIMGRVWPSVLLHPFVYLLVERLPRFIPVVGKRYFFVPHFFWNPFSHSHLVFNKLSDIVMTDFLPVYKHLFCTLYPLCARA